MCGLLASNAYDGSRWLDLAILFVFVVVPLAVAIWRTR